MLHAQKVTYPKPVQSEIRARGVYGREVGTFVDYTDESRTFCRIVTPRNKIIIVNRRYVKEVK